MTVRVDEPNTRADEHGCARRQTTPKVRASPPPTTLWYNRMHHRSANLKAIVFNGMVWLSGIVARSLGIQLSFFKSETKMLLLIERRKYTSEHVVNYLNIYISDLIITCGMRAVRR